MRRSALSRIVSGSAASWCMMGINLTVQILATSIYLSHWTLKEYGAWLAFMTITGLLQFIDMGHQSFLQNEFFRIGLTQREYLERVFWSSLPIAMILGLVEVAITLILVGIGALSHMLGPIEDSIVRSIGLLLIVHIIVWTVSGSIGGILTRMLAVYGYYSRFAWWGVFLQGVGSILPIIAVIFGGGLLSAGLTMLAWTCVGNCLLYLDLYRTFKRESIRFQKPSLVLGAQNLAYSLVISLKALLDMLRQQGIRLLLAPLAGLAGLAAFVTMRTGANVALQGLGTITNPLMPELMRFLNQRDQARMEAAFSTVWVVVVAAMAPSVVILQVIVAPLFTIWTHGKIQFDPILFALLSLGVLVYAAAQPAMAVAQGNNLLRPQLILSGLAGGVVVGGMFLLVPKIGILGAGWSLLIGEIVAAIGYVKMAAVWLNKNNLHWPEKAFYRVFMSVLTAGIAMFGIALLPKWRLAFLFVSLFLAVVILQSYWRHLPILVKHRMTTIITKFPGGRRIAAMLG